MRVFTSDAGREVLLDSAAEHRSRLVVKARRDVVSIQEQPEPVSYVDNEGRHRRRTFDFLVTLANGERIAIEVKASVRVTEKLRSEIALIAAHMDPSFACGVAILTDKSVPRAVVTDALLLDSVKRDTDYDAYRILSAAALTMHGPISIRDLGAMLCRPTSGFRAVVRLIADGVLERVANSPFSLDTLVRPVMVDTTMGIAVP